MLKEFLLHLRKILGILLSEVGGLSAVRHRKNGPRDLLACHYIG